MFADLAGGGVHLVRDLFDKRSDDVRLKLDGGCAGCCGFCWDLGSGCGVFGVNDEYEVSERLMMLLEELLLDNFLLLVVDSVSLSRLVGVGVAIIELIMFVVGVGAASPLLFVGVLFANGSVVLLLFVVLVGENNSSSCFFADKNGS